MKAQKQDLSKELKANLAKRKIQKKQRADINIEESNEKTISQDIDLHEKNN